MNENTTKTIDGLRRCSNIAAITCNSNEMPHTAAFVTEVSLALVDALVALDRIAYQCGDFAERQPAMDYATIGNVARSALVSIKAVIA